MIFFYIYWWYFPTSEFYIWEGKNIGPAFVFIESETLN